MHKLELLVTSHDRDGFDCGAEPLNLFLKQTARQHAKRGISRTFVLVDEHIAAPKASYGLFSLHLCQIKSETLALPEVRKLPRQESAAGSSGWPWPDNFNGRRSVHNCLWTQKIKMPDSIKNASALCPCRPTNSRYCRR